MEKPSFQFSLAALLLTIAAVAGDLALMFQVPKEPAQLGLMVSVIVLTALGLTGAVNGPPALRTFCIGALVPLGTMLAVIVPQIHGMTKSFGSSWNATFHGQASIMANIRILGCGLLASIALGYLCLGFRWLIERREG